MVLNGLRFGKSVRPWDETSGCPQSFLGEGFAGTCLQIVLEVSGNAGVQDEAVTPFHPDDRATSRDP